MKLLQVVDYVSASAHRHGPGGMPGGPPSPPEMPGGGAEQKSGQEGMSFLHVFMDIEKASMN